MALKITLLSVRPGSAHTAAWDAPVDDYLKRCGRDLAATSRVFRTEAALLDGVAADRRSGAAALWLADLGGKVLTTEAFAARVETARDNGTRHLMMAVGPADGWSQDARQLAELRLSLSAMTLPHELARLLLAEQIYRAATILQGHPYHLGH